MDVFVRVTQSTLLHQPGHGGGESRGRVGGPSEAQEREEGGGSPKKMNERKRELSSPWPPSISCVYLSLPG